MLSLARLSTAIAPLFILKLCFLSTVSSSSARDDMVTSLPGQPPVNFTQYAGYIAVDDVQQKNMFYYFVEAESDPHSKPLILWLNGGPGCSSVGGAFYRHGPFMPSGNDLIINEFSWNKEANVLFLDSPAGVGFSYSSKPTHNFTNDEITAQDNLMFLLRWFERYPAYKNRDFYVTGVSYAGHYVPQLAKLILKSRLQSNLKGIAMGSPALDIAADYNNQAVYLWSHGLISDSTYSMFNSICNMSHIYRQIWEGGNISSACSQVLNQYLQESGQFVSTSITDVGMDVCLSLPSTQAKDGVDPCLTFEINQYFNRKDVKEALHAKLVGVDAWTFCTSFKNISYISEDFFEPIIPVLSELLRAGVRVMGFSGDQDSLIPFMGTRTMLNVLAKDLGLNNTLPYTSWLKENQVGGWTQMYGNNMLSFATVRGGGHDSAFAQPDRTLFLINTFLRGEKLPTAK